MAKRRPLDFWEQSQELLRRLHSGGVLCTVASPSGERNVLTLGWGLVGPFYHGHPICAIAVTPLRHSWQFLEEGNDFCLGVPDESLSGAVAFCGKASGRDMDKFSAAGLTPVPNPYVRSPAILECPINIACRIYERVHPPHNLLTPEHRQRPLEEQHTIYFAEVVNCHGWERH